MYRIIEERTVYPSAMGPSHDLYEAWEKNASLTKEAQRVCFTSEDYAYFVRKWNAAAKKAGENTRIRSVEVDWE
jgi:hypothetical protein